MKKLELNVKGIECMGCENRIKNSISELENIKEVNVNHENGKVNIIFKKEVNEDIKETIINKIERLDFEVEK